MGDALSGKERVKSRRVRGIILAAQSEAFKQENVLTERLHGLDQQMERKGDEIFYHSSIRCAPFEALYGRKCKSPVLWAEIGEINLIRLETTDKVVLIKEKLKAVLLKVSPWKGVVHFGKKGKLAPRYVGPFEILERIGPVAYQLRLPEELSSVHDIFHGLNLKKCLASECNHVEDVDVKTKRSG
ncbi:hypothetical protein Tco_0910688 [Tanacetum coccineum]|uniref:Tf2-1-like SH3-like domain-containing protein n=1 Tax=Tanacetum coccineum TaxID=301880 RepID=A0ABQ5CU25_9ASTR